MKIVTVILEVEGEFDMDPTAEKYPPSPGIGDEDNDEASLPCAMLSMYAHAEAPEIRILSVEQREAD